MTSTSSYHTRWSLVQAAKGDTPQARAALSELCEIYYRPIEAACASRLWPGTAPGWPEPPIPARRATAEPVSALYEQSRVRHAGYFPELEDQLTTWDATDATQPSPDRVDALVWALTELFVLAPPPAPFQAGPSGKSRWAC